VGELTGRAAAASLRAMSKHPLIALSLLAALVASLGAVGCTSGAQVQRGIDLYQVGNDTAAMQQFRSIETDQSSFNPKGLMRYYVYRGLTAYDLGDKDQARTWLVKGKAAYARGDARWLPPNIIEKMNTALKDLGE
jgi:hypothetical protein